MSERNRIIGIDLGTTNSVVAVVLGSEPEVIPNAEGGNKTPSIVTFLDNGEVVVGEIALRQAATNPHRTISSVKRLMGRSLDEIEESGELFPYQLVSHEGELLVDVDGMGYRPEQISALVLKKLKESAEAYLGEEITQAVITVPAYFDDLQRQATIDAAEMSGLEVLRLINEPTAAAMAYGLGRGDDQEEVIAVYDFGGGTFDITILEISGKTFEVLTSTGDSRLGGDDLDLALVRQIADEFKEEHGVDLGMDPVTLRRLKEVAERAKCELSTTRQTQISLPFIAYRDNEPLHLDRVIRREEFEDLIDEFVRRTIKCCRRALEEAGLSKKDINRVILVGGITRIPLVQDSVEEFFDREAFRGVNPDEVVALGAATQAGIFEGNVQEVILLDVTPHSLGIEVEGGRFSRILDKNSTIPTKAAKTFTTTEENQQFVNIHVLQGESDDAAENRSLGKFSLTEIPPDAAGVPRIRVTFFINADGVVEISAEDMKTGSSQDMRIVHSQLTEEERGRRARRRRSGTQGGSRNTTRRRGQHVRKPEEEIAAASEKPFTQPRALDNSRATPRPIPPGHTPPPIAPPAQNTPPPVATPPPAHSESSSANRQPQEFALLGDTNPGPGRHSVSSCERDREAARHGGLQPVDYSKAPPMYSSASPEASPRPTQTPSAPGPPPQAATPAPTPPATPAASAPAEAREDGAPLPPSVREAMALAEKGSDDNASQNAYMSALGLLAKEPLNEAVDFDTLRARVLLHSMAGQLEEARSGLAGLRAHHVKRMPAEVIGLHDFVLERFNTPAHVLRDRGLAKEQSSDIAGACTDLEQALRLDPDSTDRDYLEKLYRRRAEETKDPAALFKLVKILLKKNEVDDAIGVLQELQRYPDYEKRALKVLGLCHWQKNMHFLAWQSFRTLPVDDDLKDILYRLASDMEGADHLSNAVQVLEHLNEQSPGYRDVEARLRKLNYRLKLQREDDASHKGVPVLSRDSRFTILEEINRGSMGIIFKAKDRTLNEIVALKVLNDYLCSDPSAVERFKSEARAAKKLAHPYIVRIHDLFEVDNKRFISMEYIEGVDLKTMIQERTQFGEEQIIYYFLQICDALGYAHRLGIVHRDIKPANIMITNENAVKITDFGIAKMLRGDDMTNSGTAVIGTPLYMAPEQIIGERVDGRTDIYSLGIMFYEMVSGNPPFYLGNIEYHHIHTAPPPLPERVSERIRNVIMKMISKSPDDRFASVEELLPAIKEGKM